MGGNIHSEGVSEIKEWYGNGGMTRVNITYERSDREILNERQKVRI